MQGLAQAAQELEALGGELDAAAEALLSAAEAGLAGLSAASGMAPADRAKVGEALQRVLEACAFQDLAGQRLAKVQGLLAGQAPMDGGLENGPALEGQGLGQDAADKLFAALR